MTDDPQAPQTACRVYRGLEELPAEQVAARLNLQSHREGGFFRETYRSPFQVGTDAGPRPLSTVILYLLTSDDPSRFHRLRSDEMWYYHAGGPAEMVLLAPGGAQVAAVNLQVIGLDSPQLLVPAGHWLASRVIAEDQVDWGAGRAPERRWTADRRTSLESRWTLVSCMVSPGFEYDDFELAQREVLLSQFPQARRIIKSLT
jgi:predicted cupin superfamily sugar epimerase